MKMRVQITLDERLVARLDDCFERHYMSRSQIISIALVEFLGSKYSKSKRDIFKGGVDNGHGDSSSEKRS